MTAQGVMFRLDPRVLDEARARGGYTSDERLANAIGLSSTSMRNLRQGRTTPSIRTLMLLRAECGRPLDAMVLRVPSAA